MGLSTVALALEWKPQALAGDVSAIQLWVPALGQQKTLVGLDHGNSGLDLAG